MRTIIAGFLTLIPALIAFVFVVGIPVLLGAYLLEKLRVADRVIRAGDCSMDRDRHQGPTVVAGFRKAMPV